MKKTRVSALLNLQFPILQGGMLWIATAELASAVSNSGALGIISPYAGMGKDGDPADNLIKQIDRTRQLTKNPFGVNIPLDLKQSGLFIDLLIKEKVKIVVTAAGNPDHFTGLLKQEGITVLHVISSVRQALIAEAAGVDAVIAEGVEAAAHNGLDEIPLFSLIPQVVDEISIPVIGAGGIADARGFFAALALGAEGIQMGSRFVAVEENIAGSAYKQAIVAAKDTDTMITARELVPTRSLKTEFTIQLHALERSGASKEELLSFLGYRSSRNSQIEGRLDEGEAYCGASAGLIREILPVSLVIKNLVEGYETIRNKMC